MNFIELLLRPFHCIYSFCFRSFVSLGMPFEPALVFLMFAAALWASSFCFVWGGLLGQLFWFLVWGGPLGQLVLFCLGRPFEPALLVSCLGRPFGPALFVSCLGRPFGPVLFVLFGAALWASPFCFVLRTHGKLGLLASEGCEENQ